jgi:hypothetical protein
MGKRQNLEAHHEPQILSLYAEGMGASTISIRLKLPLTQIYRFLHEKQMVRSDRKLAQKLSGESRLREKTRRPE